METIYSILASAIASFLGIFFGSESLPDQPSLSAPELSQFETTITLDGLTYQVYWYKTQDHADIQLWYNLEEKAASMEARESLNCDLLINGGFYNPEYQPIGWFYSQGGTVSPAQTNALFNGYIYRSKDNPVSIKIDLPDLDQTENLIFGMQTGPILYYSGEERILTLNQDKPARRSIVATTDQDQALFAMITSHDSRLSGPLLSDLPQILTKFAQSHQFTLEAAINLDGGSASAFLSPQTTISEIKTIGSYFCVTR